jgi:hypothetical protein
MEVTPPSEIHSLQKVVVVVVATVGLGELIAEMERAEEVGVDLAKPITCRRSLLPIKGVSLGQQVMEILAAALHIFRESRLALEVEAREERGNQRVRRQRITLQAKVALAYPFR